MKLKKYRKYQAPRVAHAYLEVEDCILGSSHFGVTIDSWQNMNDPEDPTTDGDGEAFYLES